MVSHNNNQEEIISVIATDGSVVEFINEAIGFGNNGTCYFSADRNHSIFIYNSITDQQIKCIDYILGDLSDSISLINPKEGYYSPSCCKDYFNLPQKKFYYNGKVGLVYKIFPDKYYFNSGKFQGKEKEAKWFASAKLKNRFLLEYQKGDWRSMLGVCLNIARAMSILESQGIALCSLSYNDILIDPDSGSAYIKNFLENTIIPNATSPDWLETPDFSAPEVVTTRHLKIDDPHKVTRSILTNRHSLSVLFYMLLLNRHPLRGGRVCDLDPAKDEALSMGAKALFIEHPTDKSNRPKVNQMTPSELPQGDVTKRPYTICGPYLKALFDRAFIDGLHDPMNRPSANDWEDALMKTMDLMLLCQNPICEHKWFVFDNSTKPKCPFCCQEYHGQLPVLNFYYSHEDGKFVRENHKLMVYERQSLCMWHVNRNITPSENINEAEKGPVGDFRFNNGKWILINRKLDNMWDVSEQDNHKQITIGSFVELSEGKKVLLDTANGGRLILVQLVHNYNYFAKEVNDARDAYYKEAYYKYVGLAENEHMQGLIYECYAKNAEQYLEPDYEESEVDPFAIEAKEYRDKARRCSDREADYRRQADYYMGLYEDAVRNAKKYDDE